MLALVRHLTRPACNPPAPMSQVHPEEFEDVADDKEFARLLLEEEAVFVLPGSCFGADNFFRVVFTAPQPKLEEAFARIVAFCGAHAKKK